MNKEQQKELAIFLSEYVDHILVNIETRSEFEKQMIEGLKEFFNKQIERESLSDLIVFGETKIHVDSEGYLTNSFKPEIIE